MVKYIHWQGKSSTGASIILIDASHPDSQFDSDGGRWVTFCEEHSWVINHETQSIAWNWRLHSDLWCEGCMKKEIRTAPVPNSFWEKHQSDATQRRFNTMGGMQGSPSCTLCGRTLNPEKAQTVRIIHGGGSFLHPEDTDLYNSTSNGADDMGCWDLGSECARLAPAAFRAPYLRSS